VHIKENQNLCIQLVKVNLQKQNLLFEQNGFVILDLTPPISGDLADKFRQTIILVSDRPASVKKELNLLNLLKFFFFSF